MTPEPAQETCLLFHKDMTPGHSTTGPTLMVERDEMIDFAKRWEPMPFDVDDAAGVAAFGSLTTPGVFVLALKQRLAHQLPQAHDLIASLGYDDARLHEPVRPNDRSYLKFECVAKRDSRSKPDRGAVTKRLPLIHQAGTTVTNHLDGILVRRRQSLGIEKRQHDA